jgi:hypothetical protein
MRFIVHVAMFRTLSLIAALVLVMSLGECCSCRLHKRQQDACAIHNTVNIQLHASLPSSPRAACGTYATLRKEPPVGSPNGRCSV